jgi:hypothetical protein
MRRPARALAIETEDGFEVRRSNIPDAGAGLFVASSRSSTLRRGTVVGEYIGTRYIETSGVSASDYSFHLPDGTVIDALDHPDTLVRYINDPRGSGWQVNCDFCVSRTWPGKKKEEKTLRPKAAVDGGGSPSAGPSCPSTHYKDRHHGHSTEVLEPLDGALRGTRHSLQQQPVLRVFVVLSRDVDPGEELLTDYGDDFWTTPEQQLCACDSISKAPSAILVIACTLYFCLTVGMKFWPLVLREGLMQLTGLSQHTIMQALSIAIFTCVSIQLVVTKLTS